MDQFYENASVHNDLPVDFDVAVDLAGAGMGDSVASAFTDAVSEALADPLIRAVMSADKVDPSSLETMLRKLARTIAAKPSDGGGYASAGCGCRG
jgi:hypothetical protein